jgi:zinc resistance-associated protein
LLYERAKQFRGGTKMKRIGTIVGTMLLVAAIAVPVFAHGPGWAKNHGRGYGQGGPGYCRNYDRGYENLTDEQRDQLAKLSQKFHDENSQLKNEVWKKRTELDAALNSTNPDGEKAKALQKEISDLKAKMAQNRIDFQLEAKKIAPEVRMGRGYGKGYRPGKGYGRNPRGFGQGGCWN